MKTTKVNSKSVKNGVLQDKTDWSQVYDKSQDVVDREAAKDTDNRIKSHRYRAEK